MSILKALAVSARPILTFSITVVVDSGSGTGFKAVLGAGSPANLAGYGLLISGLSKKAGFGLQVGHDHKKAFTRVFICLKLVVCRVHASSTAE